VTDIASPILITGAGGHQGRVVSHEANRAGLPTCCGIAARRSLGSSNQVHADSPAPMLPTRFCPSGAGTVIHLAAITGARCEQNPEAAHATNVTATLHLAEAAARAGATRFVFASTAAVYGDAYAVHSGDGRPRRQGRLRGDQDRGGS